MRGYRLYEVFAACPPGFEPVLSQEIAELKLPLSEKPKTLKGGMELQFADRKSWLASMALANLSLRSATRILARLARFPVHHLAQLDKRAHRVEWAEILPSDSKIHVDASCSRSRIYHSDAAAQRVFQAVVDLLGAQPAKPDDPEMLRVFVRIERDLCTISLDSSGAPLYRRGAKTETAKAPLRENLAAGLLLLAGWAHDRGEALYDPMCGSGSFLIEGAALACRRPPGLERGFDFERFRGHDAGAFAELKRILSEASLPVPPVLIAGSDHAAAALGAARRNLERAGLAQHVPLQELEIGQIRPPAAQGLLVVNPPYGKRLGQDSRENIQLYAQLGEVFRAHFTGWRLALLTPHAPQAKATGLRFARVSDGIPHGGLKVKLYMTDPTRR